MTKHFLDLHHFSKTQLLGILKNAAAMKKARGRKSKGTPDKAQPLKGKMLAMIFEKPSTRTRVSFEMAMQQLGGKAIVLSAAEMQLGKSESIGDTARVLSRYVDGIMIRTFEHSKLLEMAEHATVPVINGLTNDTHPCQLMADLLTVQEHKGEIAKQHYAWVGDGNNVAASWVHAIGVLGGTLAVATPEEFQLPAAITKFAASSAGKVSFIRDPALAVRDADCVITDAWVSMHDRDGARRHNIFKPYQVNAALMKQAKNDAIFMHCLPAHRNEEVTDDVMDGPNSVVFDEAENRLHAQKAILVHCMGK